MLFDKAYYALDEVVNRFNVTLADIEYYAEQETLEICVRFAEVLVNAEQLKRLTIQQDNTFTIRKNKLFITKPQPLIRDDACTLFRRKRAVISSFKRDDQIKSIQSIDKPDILIKFSDMVIQQQELSNFSDKAPFFIADFNGAFKHKNNYQKIICNGIEFSFGEIQAQVIRQLYYASKTNNPWVNGKILLKNAGSDTERFHSIFRRHPKWRKLIYSDKKGNYCLNIKSIRN